MQHTKAYIPTATIDDLLANTFAALGDSTRLKIFNALLHMDTPCVSDLAEHIGISVSGVSQHLKILEHAGLVQKHRNCHKICYEVLNDTQLNKNVIKTITI
jgi:DNA-binding transcriptional ArsR family regulator